MTCLVTNASDLNRDSEIAEFLFNTLAVDETADPLYILLQREAEALDEDVDFYITHN